VHRLSEKPGIAGHSYGRDVQMTKALALAAHRAGVRRMVYLSSIKALADRSPNGALTRNFPPKPVDPYGRSKLEAERALAVLSGSTGLQVVVIRPPLVYGSGASANFRQLVRWVSRGVPLPLAGVHNRRSVVSIDNLANFIVRCLGPIDGAFNVFHVSDPEPVSTPQLLRYVAADSACGRACSPFGPISWSGCARWRGDLISPQDCSCRWSSKPKTPSPRLHGVPQPRRAKEFSAPCVA